MKKVQWRKLGKSSLGVTMGPFIRFFAIPATIYFSSAAAAKPLPSDRFLQWSKINDLLGQSFVYVRASLKQATDLDAKEKEKILSLGERIYRKNNLYRLFREVFARKVDANDLKPGLKWIGGSHGQGLARALDEVFLSETYNRAKIFLEKNQDKKIKTNRETRIRTLIRANQHAKYYVRLREGADFAVNLAKSANKAKKERASHTSLKRQARKNHGSFLRDGNAMAFSVSLYVMRKFKGTDIDEFAKFFSSTHGQGLTETMLESLEFTLDRAAITLAKQLDPKLK